LHAKSLLNDHKILEIAKHTLELESESIAQLIPTLNQSFVEVVQCILESSGRVVVTGIGKSAIIGQKIVATLNSTGTPSLFMHAADAIHGDLGMIQQHDVVICISKSGNSPEIKALIPLLKQGHNPLVGMTGNLSSTLAQQSAMVLNTTVDKEACPNNLAPTTSTTAQLAMGDALAVALLSCREFTEKDFAKYHPGGALGKKIYLRIEDMAQSNLKPVVSVDSSLKECIIQITEGRMGAVAVLDGDRLEGLITDGDLRRMLSSTQDLSSVVARDIMTRQPKTIAHDVLAVRGGSLIKEHKINHLIVTNAGRFDGIVHIQGFMREGLI
jgi:arabinose-5-phosphate isomerase